jgi:hypothetical protein
MYGARFTWARAFAKKAAQHYLLQIGLQTPVLQGTDVEYSHKTTDHPDFRRSAEAEYFREDQMKE